jgi:hypothetical protein
LNRRHLYLLALGLTAIGLGISLYKALVLRFPLVPGRISDIWNVEARLTFVARNEPVKVALFVPRSTRRFAIVNENFISQGYGITTVTEDGNRQAVWSIRKAKGQQTLYYQVVVRRAEAKEPPPPSKQPGIDGPKFEGPSLTAAESLIAEVRARSADVDTMARELVKHLNQPQPDDNVALLLGKGPSALKKAEVAVQVLAQADIPARIVHGIRVQEYQRDATLIHLLEVYDKDRWQSYDPITGEPGIPHDYLPWWRGIQPLVRLQVGDKLHTTLSISLNQEAAISAALERGRMRKPLLVEFSLLSLPIQAQTVYRVLLLVPVGAFFLVLLRNVVGIKTFGTFMPVLIALAFRETQLLWGIVLFSSLVALGLSIRFYLERLKLLLVPRLASVLFVVVLLMSVLSVLTHKLGLERGLSVALFPMVILTMTIERMSIVWEERGANEALQQGLGSLLVAALAYLVMTIDYVEHLGFIFPELLLLLLAGILLLGRYSGYRLLELLRFRALVKGKP